MPVLLAHRGGHAWGVEWGVPVTTYVRLNSAHILQLAHQCPVSRPWTMTLLDESQCPSPGPLLEALP